MEKSKDIQTKFDEVRFYTDNPKEMLNHYTAESVYREYDENLRSAETGEVVTVNRKELIFERGEQLTADMLSQVQFFLEEGSIKRMYVSNQCRSGVAVYREYPMPYIVNVRLGSGSSKFLVRAASMEMAIAEVTDWCEQKIGGAFEVIYAKLASDFTIIEDTLRKLEREELAQQTGTRVAEQDGKEEKEYDLKYYQIDARTTVVVDGEVYGVEDEARTFLLRVKDADLAKVLIKKWLNKRLDARNVSEDRKIAITLDEAVVFNCNKIIPNAFSEVYMQRFDDERAIAEAYKKIDNLSAGKQQ